jgi:hypothetical protein
MGYDLHITRRNNWAEEGNDITSEEWLSLVANDPELHFQTKNGPYFVTWDGDSRPKPSWMNWSKGQIITKNPDDALIDKMMVIAQKLKAKVQGDEGELYRSSKDAHKPTMSLAKFLIRYKLPVLIMWLKKPFAKPITPAPQFKVGDRVFDTDGEIVVIKSIDRRASHGYGTVTFINSRGFKSTRLLFAHGLLISDPREKINKPNPKNDAIES